MHPCIFPQSLEGYFLLSQFAGFGNCKLLTYCGSLFVFQNFGVSSVRQDYRIFQDKHLSLHLIWDKK